MDMKLVREGRRVKEENESQALFQKVVAGLEWNVGRGHVKTEAGLFATLRWLAMWRSHVLERELWEHSEGRVLGGPFAGMRYLKAGTEGGMAPRMLGSYESELHSHLEAFIRDDFERIAVIGCAEGYYAVGLALRCPSSEIMAYDIKPEARQACRELAELNGVSARVTIGCECDPNAFANLAKYKTLIFCDIEGDELTLMDPGKNPALASIEGFIVECHEEFSPGISTSLQNAFATSHNSQLVTHKLSAPELPAWMDRLTHLDQLLALWEWRTHPTPWLVLRRRPTT